MNNMLNRIYVGDSYRLADKELFHYIRSNLHFIFDIPMSYIKTVKDILEEIYNFELEIKPKLIDYINNRNNTCFSFFFFPLRELTEEERFYIVMKYGSVGQSIITNFKE